MEDPAIIVRGRCMAKPGEQLMIRNEVYLRIQAAYTEAGVEFAQWQVAMDLPHGIEPGNEQAEEIGEGAAAALAQEERSPA